jgi:putative transport protein
MAQAFRQAKARRFFDIRGNAEMSFISIGIGMALGLLLGMIAVQVLLS